MRTGTSYAGVGRRRMRSVSCAPVECVDGFVWIVIGGFWCTLAGFYASTGIKRCCRVSSQEGMYSISFGFSSKTQKRSNFTIGCLVTARTSQIKMACAALASPISLYFWIVTHHLVRRILWQRSNGTRILMVREIVCHLSRPLCFLQFLCSSAALILVTTNGMPTVRLKYHFVLLCRFSLKHS